MLINLRFKILKYIFSKFKAYMLHYDYSTEIFRSISMVLYDLKPKVNVLGVILETSQLSYITEIFYSLLQVLKK